MSLLGLPILAALAVVAVVLPAVAVLAWPRLRPQPVAVLSCTVLLLVAQLAGVGLAAALVNRSGHYFTSWDEIWGSGAAPASLRTVDPRGGSGSTPATAGSLSTRPDPGFSSRGQWAERGRLLSITLTGASSGLVSHGYVYLPAQYFQGAYHHTRFPAAEVFTGYPGTVGNLIHALDYPGVLRSETAGGRAHPMVLVMMRTSLDYRRDLECTNVPAGPQTLTFLAQDVPSAVSEHFRAQPSRWGAIGDSTGGYCSVKLAMTYPATFRAAVSLSGYYRALMDHTTGDLYAGSPVVRDTNDLIWRLRHEPAPAVSLLATVSKQETGPDGYRNTEAFLRQVKAPMQVASLITPHGGHNFRAWSALLPRSIDWLSSKLTTPEVLR